eukprot:15389523-Alexandrium_andersonii.AAC.1
MRGRPGRAAGQRTPNSAPQWASSCGTPSAPARGATSAQRCGLQLAAARPGLLESRRVALAVCA